MALKLYFDLMSQPSRAVYMFMKLNQIPFEAKPVALRKGEHLSEEYAKINPFKLVPVIEDNGFKLTESAAIMKYLSLKCNVADNWYPHNDLQRQARIDEYLHWHHANARMSAAMLFRNLLIIPRMTNKPINWDKVEHYRGEMSKVVTNLQNYFLKDQPFLAGNDISIADIQAICELYQLYGVHEEKTYMDNPTVSAWIERVKQRLNPHFDDASKMVLKVRDMFKQISNM